MMNKIKKYKVEGFAMMRETHYVKANSKKEAIEKAFHGEYYDSEDHAETSWRVNKNNWVAEEIEEK